MNLKSIILLFIGTLIVTNSCKKESLEGDATILIGKWKATKFADITEYYTDWAIEIDDCIASTIEFKKREEK